MGNHLRTYLAIALLLAAGLLLAACATAPAPAEPTVIPTFSPVPTLSATPSPAPLRTQRSIYPTPRYTPITPIPEPLAGIALPEDVRVLVLLGTDSITPFNGRTDAVTLVFYHPRLGRAALLPIPPDLFVYIPGYTMQRLNTAYAIGEYRRLADTLEYNFGVRPDDYVLVHLEDFVYFIDDLGGLEVTVTQLVHPICGDIPPGTNLLSGDQVMCYIRIRDGADERDRALRQQDVLRLIIQRMVSSGNLTRLPDLYQTYRGSVKSSLSLDEVLKLVPFALGLGDRDHLGFFQLSGSALVPWQLPDGLKAEVFLPNRKELLANIQDAINYVLTPAPFSEMILTLEYELTISPTPTNTGTPTPTGTATATYPPTSTSLPSSTPTITSTPTPTGSITTTITVTPTVTP